MLMDEYGYVHFKDRAALNYRWKGENISAIEVENTISRLIGLKDVAAYGVKIPGADGYPGMVTIADPDGAIEPNQLLAKMKEELPSYAIPIFIRISKTIEVTGKKTRHSALFLSYFRTHATGESDLGLLICVWLFSRNLQNVEENVTTGRLQHSKISG